MRSRIDWNCSIHSHGNHRVWEKCHGTAFASHLCGVSRLDSISNVHQTHKLLVFECLANGSFQSSSHDSLFMQNENLQFVSHAKLPNAWIPSRLMSNVDSGQTTKLKCVTMTPKRPRLCCFQIRSIFSISFRLIFCRLTLAICNSCVCVCVTVVA